MEELKQENYSMDDPRVKLVGAKPEHYIPIFDDMEKQGGTAWNWCGFLVAPMWFAYRKMYGWAVLSFIIPAVAGFAFGLVLSAVSADGGFSDTLGSVISLVIAIIFGAYANTIYKKRIDRLVKELPADEAAQESFVKSKGGVSVAGTAVALVLFIIFNFLIALPGMAV